MVIVLLLPTIFLVEKTVDCNNDRITELTPFNYSIANILLCKLIIGSVYNQTVEGENKLTPVLVVYLSIQLNTGRGTGTKTCGINNASHSQNITRLNQPRQTSSSRGWSPRIFYHPSCESKRVAGLISRICPIVLESFDLHLRHSGGISFSTLWKIKSDVRKSRGFLFFITFYVESKLEWSFYGQW